MNTKLEKVREVIKAWHKRQVIKKKLKIRSQLASKTSYTSVSW